MRSTKRLLDRSSRGLDTPRALSGSRGLRPATWSWLAACGSMAVVPAASMTMIGVVASCSSEGASPLESGDASVDATVDDVSPFDAGLDVTTRDVAAPPFDGGPLPVVCASTPCAKSLVMTLGRDDSDRGEGYCVLLDDGTVACWGANGAGQLGRGEAAGASDDPTAARVVGLSEIQQINHTCALDKSGGVWCWGTGPYLRNGTGARTTERTPQKLPIPPATLVGVGTEVGCASVEEGLLCWGANTNGQLAPLGVQPSSATLAPQAISLPLGPPLREVLVGRASFVLREDGVALSWGANPPLGRISSLSPDPYPMPLSVAGISSIDVASESGCLTRGGTGYCWGNVVGSAAADSPLARAVPDPVLAPEHLVQIATTPARTAAAHGADIVRPRRWCAVGASGNVYCWGDNTTGQAGNGTKAPALETVKVEGLPAPAAQVKTMSDSTCALLTNGKVYCWGSNYYGQLGVVTLRAPSLVPREVVLP
jgi:Regulator of chromosome condensation (RCC1) repeat